MKLTVFLFAAFIPVGTFAGVLTVNSPEVKEGELSLEAGISLDLKAA